MPARELPVRPNLEQYKKQAKELVKAFRAGDEAALQRVRDHHPRPAGATFDLADAQLVIAREHGYESWPKFKQQVERASDRVPADAWKTAEDAIVAGNVAALERVLREYGDRLHKQTPQSWWHNTLAPSYDAGDARAIIARTHHFKSFEELEAFTRAITDQSSPVARFEEAVDAIVRGDLPTVQRLLRDDASLIAARSVRVHHSTLLHYVGANGIEGFRQHTPPNAVAIAEALLDAGAEVDAVADMYRGSTTLGLVATSRHPRHAGVQLPLIQLLLDRGARTDHPANAGGHSLVDSCIANGCPQAAEYLVSRGAPLDVESAAALGRLDVVRARFDAGAAPLTTEQLAKALVSAAFNNHVAIVDCLLDHGVGVDAESGGFTAVNVAAMGGRAEAVRLLMSRGASIEIKNTYGGTSLGSALWGALNTPDNGDYVAVIGALLAAGARIEPGMPEWWDKEASSVPAYSRIRQLLGSHGHRS